MGRKKRPYVSWMQKSPQDNHFFKMYDGLIMSPAYSKLSNNAKAIYNLLRANLYDSGNSAKCPYQDINKYTGVHRNYIRGHLDELIQFGFIEIKEDIKSTKRGVGKPSNVYQFIDKWKTITETDAKEIKKQLKKSKNQNDKNKEKSKIRIKEMNSKEQQSM